MFRHPYQFRVKTLLTLIAMLALAMGSVSWVDRMQHRRAARLAQALLHAQLAESEANMVADRTRNAAFVKTQQPGPDSARDAEARVIATQWEAQARFSSWSSSYHRRMERRYLHAADRPWAAAPTELPLSR